METIQHTLPQFDPGMVWLDEDNRILAMNGIAMQTGNTRPGEPIGGEILSIPPERDREKVEWLVDQSRCPANRTKRL